MNNKNYKDSAVILDKGGRDYMEDTYSLEFGGDNLVYGGVYDGHGGAKTAEFLSNHLLSFFIESLSEGNSPQKSFEKAYRKSDKKLKGEDSGACAANFFFEEGNLFWANVGDSKIIIAKEGGHKELTVEHRLDNPSEQERIKEAGGEIRYPYMIKGGRGMMPTRAIGDEYFKSIGLTAKPSVGKYKIKQEDLFLVAATDGLFDVVENEEIQDLANKTDSSDELAESLRELALDERNGDDNIAIIVISLQ
ncbi:MAG: PP2C family serine/threonine-protein phosphatase [Candidatus Magasanikbacteria bacterium]